MLVISILGDVFKRAFTFSGRTSRLEYWWSSAFLMAGFVIFEMVDSQVFPLTKIAGTIYSLIVFFPMITLGCRRLHDIGKSGWLQLPLYIIPIFGWILILVFFTRRGQAEANRFGVSPIVQDRKSSDWLVPFAIDMVLTLLFIFLVVVNAMKTLAITPEFTDKAIAACNKSLSARSNLNGEVICRCIIEKSIKSGEYKPIELTMGIMNEKTKAITRLCVEQHSSASAPEATSDVNAVAPQGTAKNPAPELPNQPVATPEPVQAIEAQPGLNETGSLVTGQDAALTADERYAVQNKFIQSCTEQFSQNVSVPQRIRNLCGCLSTELLKHSTNAKLRHFQSSGAIPSHVNASVQTCVDKLN